MRELRINRNLDPEKHYAFRNPRPIWGEHLPHRKTIKDEHGKAHHVVAESEWWNQKRCQDLFLWLDRCVSSIVARLADDRSEPEAPLRERFLVYLHRGDNASFIARKRFNADIEKWGHREIAEASALRPDLLLQLADLGIVPEPGDIVPPKVAADRAEKQRAEAERIHAKLQELI